MSKNFKKMSFEEIKADKDRFLDKYNIRNDFNHAKISWEDLLAIGENYESKIKSNEYLNIIDKYISQISKFENVHSYRYRLKRTDSLLKKIIIKCVEKEENINVDNYLVQISDLLGIRILYIFKTDYYSIHEQIMNNYGQQQAENIHIKIKSGDDKEIYSAIAKKCDVIWEEGTYRSIHYTIHSNPNDTSGARLEIQTRTVFEEGWSEINHKLVYKNQLSEDYKVLKKASDILSGMVGSCDTLGSLMKYVYDEYINKEETTNLSDDINNKIIVSDIFKRFLNS